MWNGPDFALLYRVAHFLIFRPLVPPLRGFARDTASGPYGLRPGGSSQGEGYEKKRIFWTQINPSTIVPTYGAGRITWMQMMVSGDQ